MLIARDTWEYYGWMYCQDDSERTFFGANIKMCLDEKKLDASSRIVEGESMKNTMG